MGTTGDCNTTISYTVCERHLGIRMDSREISEVESRVYGSTPENLQRYCMASSISTRTAAII